MKRIFPILYLVILAGALLSGVWAGRLVGALFHSSANQRIAALHPARITKPGIRTEQTSPEFPIPGTEEAAPLRSIQATSITPTALKQQNLLVVIVDQFKAPQAQLMGAWLVMNYPGDPNFMLMPIYPSSANQYVNDPKTDRLLERQFKLTGEGKLDLGFIMVLQDQEIWWNHIIILDQGGVQELADLILNDHTSAEMGFNFDRLPSVQDSPLEALLGQARFIQEICRNQPRLTGLQGRDQHLAVERLSAHIHATLDIEQSLSATIQKLGQGGGITCEFPSMAAALLIP
jgi:hypothetical protein